MSQGRYEDLKRCLEDEVFRKELMNRSRVQEKARLLRSGTILVENERDHLIKIRGFIKDWILQDGPSLVS